VSQHTPGPWTIEPHGNGFALYAGRSADRHGMNLVYLSEPDCNWERTKALIAAAPQLFEQLKELVSNVEFADPGVYDTREAKELIAKLEAAS
jgi:hypothetical protein